MLPVYDYQLGDSALIVSMPHSGLQLCEGLSSRLTPIGQQCGDTDWHIPQLYNFLDDWDVTLIKANYSRYVVDLNRAPDGVALPPGQTETGICPITSFMGDTLYLDVNSQGYALSSAEIKQRIEDYWWPYHNKLVKLIDHTVAVHGYAILWDAHSIQSRLPNFFNGQLPDLNLGSVNGYSCDKRLTAMVESLMNNHKNTFQSVHNGRFKGGYITRHYGKPLCNVHALQMEIAQINYMSEFPSFVFDERKAKDLRPILVEILLLLMAWKP